MKHTNYQDNYQDKSPSLSVERQKQVFGMMDQLAGVIDRLECNTDSLFNRLDPILRDEPYPEKECKMDVAGLVPLAHRLANAVSSLERVNEKTIKTAELLEI